MTTLILELQKEIEAASKKYNYASKVLTDPSECLRCYSEKYEQANRDFCKYDEILTALNPMLKKLQQLQAHA